jgi:hypothetical protein
LVRHHVRAKRYLCWKEADYEKSLSEASQTTLRHQGGPMSASEAAEAEADPRWPLVLRLRSFDEAAKDPLFRLPPLRAVIRELLRANVAEDLTPATSRYVVSREQLRRWNLDGYLVIRNVFPIGLVQKLSSMADDLPDSPGLLVHHEEVGLSRVGKGVVTDRWASRIGERGAPAVSRGELLQSRGPVARCVLCGAGPRRAAVRRALSPIQGQG